MAGSVFTSGTQLAAPDVVLDNFLARPRNTASAASFNASAAANLPRTTGALQLRALFAGMPAKLQAGTRQLVYERMVLEAKVDAVLARLAEGEAVWGVEEGELALGARGLDVLQRLQVAVADSDHELARAVGKGRVRLVLEAINAPDMRDALRLSVVTEEEARELEGGGGAVRVGSEGHSTAGWTSLGEHRGALEARTRAARLWRRRLWKLTIPVRINAKLRFATGHDDVDHRGRRTLINDLNKHTAEENLSYYQRSTLQYGRERRGSTSVAGAWEGVVLSASEAAAAEAAEAAAVEAAAVGAAVAAVEGAHDRGGASEDTLLAEEAALLAEVEQLSEKLSTFEPTTRSQQVAWGGL